MLGYVYKIIHTSRDDILPYVGSTKEKLSQRMSMHRCLFKRWKEGNTTYCAAYELFDEYGVENFIIVELSRYEVSDKQELRKYEQEWIQKINCCNKIRALGLGKKGQDADYYQRHKENIKKNVREYAANNKEKISQRNKTKVVCECGFEGTKHHIHRHRGTINHIKNMFQLLPFA
jgi:hypothetical protein